MTPREECWLALSLVKGIGQKSIQALLGHFGDVEAVMAAPAKALGRVARIGPELATRIAKAREVQALQIEKRLVEENGIRLISLDSAEYPALLGETDVPPGLLYVRGEVPFPEGLYLAVVGTRRCSRYGEKTTRRLIKDLAVLEPSLVVVSGLARGIDTVAHEQALASGLKTIAVMAGGLARIYPRENEELAERIAGQGALIAEVPMTAPPLAKNFPIRNRIISGLSWGILVTEAGEKSGALITSGFGLNHNREIFAVPGNVDLQSFQGTNRLIQRGHAKLVREAEDILEELTNFRRVGAIRTDGPQAAAGGGRRGDRAGKHREAKTATSPRAGATDAPPGSDKRLVWETLGGGALHPDDISRETGLAVERLLGLLLEMELAGDIYQTAENLYAIA